MKKNKIIYLFILLTLIFTLTILISACSKKNEKTTVATTIFPITEMTKAIAGNKIEVKQILKGDPHNYEPNVEDQKIINQSKMLFMVDKDLEHELYEYTLKNIKIKEKTFEVSKGIEKIDSSDNHEHHEGSIDKNNGIKLNALHEHNHKHNKDPHIWTSPKNALTMLDNIYNSLIKIDKENKNYYKKNYEEYKEKLTKVDNEYKEVISSLSKKHFHITHGAFTYLKDYNLHQHALTNGHEEATPEQFAKYINHLVNEKCNKIYYIDSQGKEKEIADKIVREVNKKDASIGIKAVHLYRLVEKEDKISLIEAYRKNLEAFKN